MCSVHSHRLFGERCAAWDANFSITINFLMRAGCQINKLNERRSKRQNILKFDFSNWVVWLPRNSTSLRQSCHEYKRVNQAHTSHVSDVKNKINLDENVVWVSVWFYQRVFSVQQSFKCCVSALLEPQFRSHILCVCIFVLHAGCWYSNSGGQLIVTLATAAANAPEHTVGLYCRANG